MFTLPDLPYAYDALEPYVDEETMKLHHDKHHATYVKNVNDALAEHDNLLNISIEELIQNLDQVPEDVRTKVRNNGGGHANHSLFWTLMRPAPQSLGDGELHDEPTGKLLDMINQTFGSFDEFKTKFAQTATNHFGSGWAWLVVKDGQLDVFDTSNQDSPLMEGKGTPILALDVWEHAYYLKYRNVRADYVTAWWSVVNWAEVSKRFESAG